MLKNGFDPNYFRIHPDISDEYCALINTAETHDLWHLVTGFDTSVAGELGLQAFMLCQMHAPQSVIFIAGALFRTLLRDPALLVPAMDAIVRGWEMGKVYPPLFAVDWMSLMNEPLAQIVGRFSQGMTVRHESPARWGSQSAA